MSIDIIDENISSPWYMDISKFDEKLQSITDPDLRKLLIYFLRDGYVVVENSIPPDTCDDILRDFKEFEEKNSAIFHPRRDDHGHYPRMVNMHLSFAALRRLFSENEKSLAIQDAMFEQETVLYTSLFYERGSAQELHRDTPYFCTRPEYRYFGMWVALEDVDETNGPLMAMAGGHLMPELDRQAIAVELHGSVEDVPPNSQIAFDTYQKRMAEQGFQKGLQIKNLPVKKGSTIIWHPQLPHGGAPIMDLTRTRFSLVMHTTPMNTPVYHQHVFFNPDGEYSTYAPWEYLYDGGRQFAKHSEVSFDHRFVHRASDFI